MFLIDVISFIQSIIITVTLIAWILFLLSWAIGWAIRGSPIPFMRIKRTGERMVEDAVWAAFWLAMGTTVFAIIAYVATVLYQPLPEPPTI